ncbi:MAG: hypothetical protein R3F46_14490 [bacterium]
MLYRRICLKGLELALLLCLLLGLAACGGSHGFSGDIKLSASSSESALQQNDSGTWDRRSFPRRETVISYDSSGCVDADDLRLVPLTEDGLPDRSASRNFGLTVQESGAADGSRTATVTAAHAGNLHLHLHYDAANWAVKGVGIRNPWTDGRDFLSFAFIPQPGVLEVMVQSLRRNGAAEANGELAVIRLIPLTQARNASITRPSGLHSYGAAYLVTDDPPTAPASKGYLTVRLDGTLGDLSSKDNLLSGNELNSEPNDNLAHDVLVDNIGSTFVVGGQFPADLNISWTERLAGDYDNNGIVTVNDTTPVAELGMDHNYHPPIPFLPGDPLHVQSASYEPNKPGTLWSKMLDSDWLTDLNDHNLDIYFMADSQ